MTWINKKNLIHFVSSVSIVCIIFIVFMVNFSLQARADDACGEGMTCWPENGGTLYADCKPYPEDDPSTIEMEEPTYCAGDGIIDRYCSCEGSPDCTCQIGPGVTCAHSFFETKDCYCWNSDGTQADICDESQEDQYCVFNDDYEPEQKCQCTLIDICGTPTDYSTIGCCFGDEADPNPSSSPPPPSSPPSPFSPPPPSSPPPPPGISVDVKINGSDGPVTWPAYESYHVTWQSYNATWCTLNGASQGTWGEADFTHGPSTQQYVYTCGDGTTTETDTATITLICNSVTADVKANGSDTNITVHNDYTISWTHNNATSCTLNGASLSNLTSSQTYSADANGDYTYELYCENECVASGPEYSDTDSVTVTVDLCGDGVCAGFENCLSCESDCGVCPNQWFQTWGGNLFAELNINSDVSGTATYPYLSAQDRVGNPLSDGIPMTGNGIISANGRISARTPNTFVIGSAPTRFKETYSYFAHQYSLGSNPIEDFSGSADNAQKPAYNPDKAYYYHQGDLTIQEAWNVAADETYTIFIEGNLNLTDPTNINQLITVQEGGFLAFIVSGNITVDKNLGNDDPSITTANLAGLYLADGTITIDGDGTELVPDERFVGEGSFIGWTDVVLNRTLSDDNTLYPAETFIYRPDLITNTPEEMKRAQRIWQETN